MALNIGPLSNEAPVSVQAASCCQSKGISKDDNGLCFAPRSASRGDQSLRQGRCVDPFALFMTPSEAIESGELALSASRCQNVCMHTDSGDDGDDQLCIHPREDLHLLRISLVLPPWETVGDKNSKTVIWNGPKEEVWEQGQNSSRPLNTEN